MILKRGYYIRKIVFAITICILAIVFFVVACVNTSSFTMYFILCVLCFCLATYNLICFLYVPSSSLKIISQFIKAKHFIISHEFDFLHQSILIDDVNKQIIFAKMGLGKPSFRCINFSDLLSNKIVRIKTKKQVKYTLHCVMKNCDYEEIIFNLGNNKDISNLILPFLEDARKYKPTKISNAQVSKNIICKTAHCDSQIKKIQVETKQEKEDEWDWLEY